MMTKEQEFITGTFCNFCNIENSSVKPFSVTDTASSISNTLTPTWGMSLKVAGNMRFRWNEQNPTRDSFLNKIANANPLDPKDVACVELIHSRTVYAVDSSYELNQCKGDGIITQNKSLMPVVTVADCMPIFLYEEKKQVFGVLHSGWKGTGIVCDALLLAQKKYGANIKDFRIVMGPHIHSCCYKVDKNRAEYFKTHFTEQSICKLKGISATDELCYSLSLAQANMACLLKLGVPKQNIFIHSSCTCCNSEFGSFRRQTANLAKDMPLEERMKHFTVQAAWIKW